jgi:hypothetical protein
MAHKVYELEIGLKCPRCNNTQARLAIYHFGTSFTAECAGCAWGPVEGDNEAMAVARYRGKLLEAGALPPNENPEGLRTRHFVEGTQHPLVVAPNLPEK